MYHSYSRPNRSNGSSFGRNRSQSGFNRPAKRRFAGQNIDINKFIKSSKPNVEKVVYRPENTFADFAVHPTLKSNIADKNYIHPTAIQDQTIPASLDGHDVIGLANTGTGKTAAFLIPMINKVARKGNERVLIMTPTRELALQIQMEFKDFAKNMNQYATLCIGGANIGQQISQLRRNPQFVVGTPGRLKDLVERGHLNLSQFTSAVLDEADRMLDMGFVDEIKRLLALLPENRQTLFFSATMSPQIEFLTKTFLNNPVMVSVKTQDTAENVDQDVVFVTNHEYKLEQLHELLVESEFSKVLIFGETKHGVERLTMNLIDRGFKAASIHGDKTQPKRQRALNEFKRDDIQILVATDVAARGLDIPNVSHVINYDIPKTYEDYIHRIGRTGRAGNVGKALTFVSR